MFVEIANLCLRATFCVEIAVMIDLSMQQIDSFFAYSQVTISLRPLETNSNSRIVYGGEPSSVHCDHYPSWLFLL